MHNDERLDDGGLARRVSLLESKRMGQHNGPSAPNERRLEAGHLSL